MIFFVYIFFFYIKINVSLGQNEKKNYCDKNQQCKDCQMCGKDTNNYCSCNFNNIYCYDNHPGNITVLSDFLLNYDGCLSNNGMTEKICGVSDINLDSKNNNKAIIKFEKTYLMDFVCYYVINKLNNNTVIISIKKEGNEVIYFNLHLVIYYNFDQIKVSSKTKILGSSNNLEINELNVDKLSMYIDIEDASNLNKLSINISLGDNNIKIIKYYTDSNKTTKYIIYGVIIGVVAIIIIIIIICLIRRNKRKKRVIDYSVSAAPINISQQSTLNKSSKKIINDLFKKELIPKIYYRKDVTNDCYKCTICLEDFKEGLSKVVSTRCNHIFHFDCFKNWIYNNCDFPKCPNCNNPILNI